jgi:hypothetical protein
MIGMNRQKINMFGGGFYHDICSSAGHEPVKIEWVKGTNESPISIYIDYGITNYVIDKTKQNYAWLAESKTINFNLYKWCVDNVRYLEENFELIFTHDTSLLPLSNKFKFVMCGAKHWVKNVGVYNKTKLVSMIASNKVMCAEHVYRQEVIKKYASRLDLYGRGYNEIQNKEIGLNDYCFSITMENHTYPIAYSEKITDCFATGTIPIYYGSEYIGDVFNADGIIMLDDNFNIDDLSPELYLSKRDAILDNYQTAINMPIAEDYIYETYIK